MGALRNDVAHGNTGLDYAALDSAFRASVRLSRRLVLHELGIRDGRGRTADSQRTPGDARSPEVETKVEVIAAVGWREVLHGLE